MTWITCFSITIFVILPAVLIWICNVPREKRYQQFWSPCTALLLSLITAASMYYAIAFTNNPVIVKLINLLPRGIAVWLLNYKWILINSIFLYIFLIIKVLGILGNRAVKWLKRLTALRSRFSKFIARLGIDPAKLFGEKAETGSRNVAIAYVFVPGKGVYLKPEWIFVSIFFNWSCLIPCLIIITMLTIIGFNPTSTMIQYFPELPSAAFIILAEVALFLNGPRLNKLEGDMRGSGTSSETIGHYDELFKEYLNTCPERILAERRLAQSDTVVVGRDPKYCTGSQQVKQWCQHARGDDGEKRNENFDCLIYCSMVNDLLDGKNVLVTDPVHSEIAPFVFSCIYDFLTDGRRILIVVKDVDSIPDILQWSKDSLDKLNGVKEIWKIFSFDECLRSQEEPDILVVDLGCVRNDPWFDLNESWIVKMDLIFFPEGLGLEPEQMASARSLLGRLDDITPHPNQFLIFSKSYEGREPWIRGLIKAPVKEYNAGLPRAGELYTIVWKTESEDDLQRSILPTLTTLFIGEELPLSLPALRAGVNIIRLIKQHTQPWHEYIEELKKRHQMLHEYGLSEETAMGLDRHFVHEERNWQVPVESTSFMMIRDDEFNLVKSIVTWWSRGSSSCFINVISPPYLLREYLADNLEFFCKADHYISAWTPLGIESKRAMAYFLFKRLQRSYIEEKELIELVTSTGVKYSTIREGILLLLTDVFGSNHDFASYLETRVRDVFNPVRHCFEQITDYHFMAASRLNIEPEWFSIYKIQDETDHLLDLVPANLADRIFMPEQLHAFAGKLYRVISIDKLRHVVEMSFVDPTVGLRPAIYRLNRIIKINNLGEDEQSIYYKKNTKMAQWRVTHTIREADFEVSVNGYYCFEKGINLADEKQIYVDLTDRNEMRRAYKQGRVLEICISREDGEICNHGGHVGFTLTALLQELLCTLFPQTFQLLAIGTGLPTAFFNEDKFSQRLKGYFQMIEGPGIQSNDNEIRLYLLEDSEIELGILEVFTQRWNDLFRLMEDYLSWLLEEGTIHGKESNAKEDEQTNADSQNESTENARCLSRNYLCFGRESIPAVFDLAEVHKLLRTLPLGDLIGPVRRQARSQNNSQSLTELKLACCDFCGRDFPAAQVTRLQDGRERCPECNRTAINSLDELASLYQQARVFLIDHFSITLRQEINLSLNSAKEISSMSKLPFIATAGQDPRAVGVATQEETGKGKKLTIYIENGAPAKSTIYTLVHELTHIWQFDNLDINALTLEQAEGLSTWSEIGCMEHNGDREGAKRFRKELEQRQDEYWRGLLIVDEIAAKTPEYTNPFEYFVRNYPVKLY